MLRCGKSGGRDLKGGRLPSLQPSLFDEPLLPGLAYRGALIDEAEEAGLLEKLESVDVAPFQFQGWTGKRETTSFGWRYDFDDASFARTDPIPDWLEPLRRRASDFANIPAEELVQALVTRYDPGAGIGWHRDRPVFEEVVGISLGAAAAMRFRRRTGRGFERVLLPLLGRSAYHLSKEARHEWEHSIAPIDARRWSITFRSLSDKGRCVA